LGQGSRFAFQIATNPDGTESPDILRLLGKHLVKEEDTRPESTGCCAGFEMGSDTSGHCPMAAMWKGMNAKRGSRFFLLIPGILLLLIGVGILVNPEILVWLIAGVFLLIGIVVLAMAIAAIRFVGRARAHDS